MNPTADSRPELWLRILRLPPARLALLYAVLSYLYLSGFFFRASYAKGPFESVAATVMAGALMLVLYAAIFRVVERRPASELALPAMSRELALGALLGAGLYASCMAILALLGNYRVEGLNDWHVLVSGVAVALATGVYEELFFRGGVFRLLEDWLGSWAALVLSSLVFGLVHLDNDAGSLQGVLSISVWAGILLTGSYLLTRRLWLGIGLHAAWNYTQGTVFSTIVSGNAPPNGFLRSRLEGSPWLTGGSFGVEASLIAGVICSTAGVILMIMAVRRGHIVPPSWRRTA